MGWPYNKPDIISIDSVRMNILKLLEKVALLTHADRGEYCFTFTATNSTEEEGKFLTESGDFLIEDVSNSHVWEAPYPAFLLLL